jgi:redox-sensitive bicupin YhaK (pirin superfamily)
VADEVPDDDMRRKGGRFHGVQLWINMPKANKHDDPTYRHVRASEIPVLEAGDGKARTRLVAGRLGQRIGPIVTTGAPFVAHTTLFARWRRRIGPRRRERTRRVRDGGIGSQAVESGELVRLSPGSEFRLSAGSGTEIVIVGGDPLDAPIHRYGPLVMTSTADLERAVRDYQSGRMGTLRRTRAA